MFFDKNIQGESNQDTSRRDIDISDVIGQSLLELKIEWPICTHGNKMNENEHMCVEKTFTHQAALVFLPSAGLTVMRLDGPGTLELPQWNDIV